MLAVRRNFFTPLATVAGLIATAAVTVAAGPGFAPTQPPPAQSTTEERGRHVLQIAGGCGCHGANFAGWKPGHPDTFPRALPFGERFVGDFGIVPASNITSDKATGIGDWSDADLARVLTEGVNPGGETLSPTMPYHAYHGMAKNDLRALIAYLHRLRPVTNDGGEKTLKTPVAAVDWSAYPSAPEERPTEPVALGQYLVTHVCGCTDCHAPASDRPEELPLAGKVLSIGGERIVAPSLTPDRKSGPGRWSQANIARYLRTGTRPDGGLAQSVMAGLILTSYSHLTPDEAGAIAAYLKSLPPSPERAR